MNETKSTVIGQLCLCTTFAVAAIKLNQIGNAVEIASLASLGCAAIATRFGFDALAAFDRYRDRMRGLKRLKSFSDKQGKARLGDLKDVKKEGLSLKYGLPVGRLNGRLIRDPSDTPAMVCAPTGAGKLLGYVAIALLTRFIMKPVNDWIGSIVLLDFSGEGYAVTSRFQQRLGRKIVAICPEAQRMSKKLGMKIESLTSNPLGGLQPDSESIKDDIDKHSRFILPGTSDEKAVGSTVHFEEMARILLCFYMLVELLHKGVVTLSALRHRVMADAKTHAAILDEMSKCDAFGGLIAEYAGMLSGLFVSSGEEWSGVLTTASRAVALYDENGPLGRQTSSSEFNWSQIKEEPTCVYLIIPPDKLDTYAPFLNLTLSASFDAMVRHPSNNKVIYLLDEIAHASYLPTLTKGIGFYRKFGIKLVLILQQRFTQLARIYGSETAKEIIGNCEATLAFGAREIDDLKNFSELSGNKTQAGGSQTIREGSDGEPEVAYGGEYRSEPILRPEDIRQMDSNKVLFFYRNLPPLLLDKLSYLTDPQFRRRADTNPYYKEP